MTYEYTSKWLTLPLHKSDGGQQLLAKYSIIDGGYTVHITDLCHIWFEHVTKQQLLARAEKEQTSIDPSEDDAQLDILLQKIDLALRGRERSELSIVQERSARLTIAAKISLPRPLQPLQWSLRLEQMPEDCVRSEFIFPLLGMAYEKYQQEEELVRLITEKDNVISKILDKVESLGMDLASVFPNTGISKPGRKVRREVVAKHVRGLATFEREKWQEEFQLTSHGNPTLNQLIENVFVGNKNPNVQRVVSSVDEENPNGSIHSASQDPLSQSQCQNTPPTLEPDRQSRERMPSTSSNTNKRKIIIDDTTTDDDFEEAAPPRTPKPRVNHTTENAKSARTASPSPARVEAAGASSVKRKLGTVGGTVRPKQKSINAAQSHTEMQLETSTSTKENTASHVQSPSHISSSELAVDRQPIKLAGSRSTNSNKPILEKDPASPRSTYGEEATPVPQTRETKSRKLGKIGGVVRASKDESPGVPQTTSPKLKAHAEEINTTSQSKFAKPSPHKLGRIGGRAKVVTQHEPIASVDVTSSSSHAGTRTELQSNDDVDVDTEVHSKAIKEKSLTPEESIEQRADRKREELKRALENSGAATSKKKRRF